MNTIILSSVVGDVNGSMMFKFDPAKTELYSMGRRVSRRATLDGGSVIEDFGHSDSDRTLLIAATMNDNQVRALNYFIRYSSAIIVSCIDGLYLGMFESSRVKGSDVTIKILIKEKLTS